jgi:tRNA1Val (adenine37-N6)-methyltransferase
MSEKSFKFKQFTIAHEKCQMKVGTDGVLLGAWTSPDNSVTNILDVGTGSGLIALMLAQKTSGNVRIEALDFDPAACEQARENIHNSPWKNKVSVVNSTIQEYAQNSTKRFDLIVSNPPYFELSSNPLNNTQNTAKHAVTLTLEELTNAFPRLLTSRGTLCIILPINHEVTFLKLAQNIGLNCCRKMYVKPNYYKPYERILMQFSLSINQIRKADDVILIEKENRHQYSDKYEQLTKDYYLAF